MLTPLKSLKDKLEEKTVLETKLAEVDDKIDEMVGETKVKIKRTSLKKAK